MREASEYHPPWWHRNAHLATILPNRLRPVRHLGFLRETLNTPDNDFVEVDYLKQGNTRCAILLHGLEGDSSSQYILGMSKVLTAQGWDIAALNQRSCSGRPNARFESYHSGRTDDLNLLISHLGNDYDSISIVGFSLGGNIALKYAGEKGGSMPVKVGSVVAISTPCHLSDCSDKLEEGQNIIYRNRFLRQLMHKLREKNRLFPDQAISEAEIQKVRSIRGFDDLYTAPAHGFDSAAHYYEQCSSVNYLSGIRIPTLIISALDDPFLTPTCFPRHEISSNDSIQALFPKQGGHVGFAMDNLMKRTFWHEEQTVEFLRSQNGYDLSPPSFSP